MKVTVIGHTYIKRPNQEKFYKMAAASSETSFQLIVPDDWPEPHFPQTLNFKSEHPNIVIRPMRIFFGGDIRFYLFKFGKLLEAIKEFSPDIIQVDAESYCFVYPEVALARAMAAPQAKLIFFSWNNLPNRRAFPKNLAVGLLERLSLKFTDGAVCGSPQSAELLMKTGFAKPLEVIPQLGADETIYRKMDMAPLREKLGLKDCFVFGYAGRLLREKGLLTLIDALSLVNKNPRWKFLMVGNGDILREIMQKAEAAGIKDRIVHIPGTDQYRVAEYINCMDALVLPSVTTTKWMEQFGKVLIDAMSCGVPVIGSDSGAIPWVIGDAGMVFPEGDATALAGRLRKIMSDDAARAELSEKAAEKVRTEFSNDAIARRYLDFYGGLTDSARQNG